VLTHAHYDHTVNFVLFPNATVWIGEEEINWAAQQAPGFNPLPELYVRELAQSPRVNRIKDTQEFLPSLTAHLVPGHTPGHMLFVLDNGGIDVLFTGDAAKNRAELLSRKVVDTEDLVQSQQSIDLIWSKWLAKPGNLVIPGHDLTMELDPSNNPVYVGTREVFLRVWFRETVEESDLIDLTKIDMPN
jgi:glyoxylase-like metal-dependent hydrolase (beta-lactamase superfamily II)